MQEFLLAIRKYADFSSRSPRREYWMFILFYLIFSFVIGFLDGLAHTQVNGLGILSLIFSLFMLIPSLSVATRRLHDTDRSGWWQLIGIIPIIGILVLIYFLACDSDPFPNDYGPSPKADADIDIIK